MELILVFNHTLNNITMNNPCSDDPGPQRLSYCIVPGLLFSLTLAICLQSVFLGILSGMILGLITGIVRKRMVF